MFYKDILDYDTQLKAEGRAEGKAEGKAEGRAEGAENAICAAIRVKVPFPLIEAMAKEANISKKRLDELMKQVAV